MANLRELRDRIRSVNSTKQITKAQELIATSRITKAQNRVAAAAPYAREIQDVVERLASASSLEHPMLRHSGDRQSSRAAVLVVTSDRGMCGGYNHNVLKKAAELTKLLEDEGYDVVRFVTGSKGIGYYEFRDEDIEGAWDGFSQDPTWEGTHDVRRHLINGFLAGSEGTVKDRTGLRVDGDDILGFDQVHVVYTEFVSMLTQQPEAHQLLPIEAVVEYDQVDTGEDMLGTGDLPEPDVAFEPDPDTLLEALLPQYVSRMLFSYFLEASASESAARRTAMKAATDNANELVNDLSRVANAARQAQITQEITEIVGGVDALADSGESD